MNSLSLIRGDTFRPTLQCGLTKPSEGYDGGRSILSSSAANPAQIITRLPHGITTGQKVRILDHVTNTIINGNQTLTSVNTTTLSVDGVQGIAVGTSNGKIWLCTDATDFTVALALMTDRNSDPYTDSDDEEIPIDIQWTDVTRFLFIPLISATNTMKIEIGEYLLQVRYTDSDGVVTTEYYPISVKNG